MKNKKIQKVYIIYDDENRACMVKPTHATAQSYVNWFCPKDKKYQIQSYLIDPNKMSQDTLNNVMKEFEQ